MLGSGAHGVTPATIVDYDHLAVELARVRRQGYAVDREEFSEGVCCVSAPFFDDTGAPTGAFTVSVPTTRFHERRATLTMSVREAAAMATGFLRAGHLTVLPAEWSR